LTIEFFFVGGTGVAVTISGAAGAAAWLPPSCCITDGTSIPSASSCCSRPKTTGGPALAILPIAPPPAAPLPWSITTTLSMLPGGEATAPNTPVDAWMMAGSFSRIVWSRAASLNCFHASAFRRIAAASAVPCASIAFAWARPIASTFAASALPSASARPTPSLRNFFG
jgi:hypothetical protein